MTDKRFTFDPYSEGSCIYETDSEGTIVEIAAWAKNTLAANVAFEKLCRMNPQNSYLQKRRSHVENERVVKALGCWLKADPAYPDGHVFELRVVDSVRRP